MMERPDVLVSQNKGVYRETKQRLISPALEGKERQIAQRNGTQRIFGGHAPWKELTGVDT